MPPIVGLGLSVGSRELGSETALSDMPPIWGWVRSDIASRESGIDGLASTQDYDGRWNTRSTQSKPQIQFLKFELGDNSHSPVPHISSSPTPLEYPLLQDISDLYHTTLYPRSADASYVHVR